MLIENFFKVERLKQKNKYSRPKISLSCAASGEALAVLVPHKPNFGHHGGLHTTHTISPETKWLPLCIRFGAQLQQHQCLKAVWKSNRKKRS